MRDTWPGRGQWHGAGVPPARGGLRAPAGDPQLPRRHERRARSARAPRSPAATPKQAEPAGEASLCAAVFIRVTSPSPPS